MNSHPIGNVLEMANFPYTLIPHFVFAIFTHFSSTKATHLKIVRKGVPQQYLTADMPHAESSAVVTRPSALGMSDPVIESQEIKETQEFPSIQNVEGGEEDERG